MKNLTIKNLAEEDRPREKLMAKGAKVLTNAELLAIFLRTGTHTESAIHLAQRILQSVGNDLDKLAQLSVPELSKGFKGMGKVKAVTIAAALELGRRREAVMEAEEKFINNSHDAWMLFRPLLTDLLHEELWVSFTKRSGGVISQMKVSQGGVSETVVDVRIILKAGINQLASSMFLCHNHPSGSLMPSREDDQLTRRLKEAGSLMGIKLLDHIIIAGKTYYSYADEGRIL